MAKSNALVAQRMIDAGVTLFGKTNVPLLAGRLSELQRHLRHDQQSLGPTRSPGGSSGGSAAALAAGLTGIEAGSDIGSSIRNPAHYCGVYGHKPTWGVVSPKGHAPVQTRRARRRHRRGRPAGARRRGSRDRAWT